MCVIAGRKDEMKTGILAVVLLAFVPVLPGSMSVLAQEPAAAAFVADSGNRFAMDLYAQLKARPGNLFFSPYGISNALTMVYAGARGNTASEMARVLYISVDGDAWHKGFSEHMKMLKAPQGYEFTVANSLWGQTGDVFSPVFIAMIGDYYGGEFEQVDFLQASVAAGRINMWVSDKTSGKIQDIVSPDNFGGLTRLVLVNAVYFKGEWNSPFKKIHTQNGRFYTAPQDGKIVAMMHQLANFSYMENEQLQILELPYADKDLAMVIILPRQVDGLSAIEKEFDAEHYKDWISNLSDRQVDVTLPKFKTTAELSLVQTLSGMGIREAFSGIPDFSGMSDEAGLQIGDVLHKAFVDVTEEGTEAAAATAVVMLKGIALETPSATTVSFVADHPFLYVIRDRRTGSILFMGRVFDPEVGARPVGDVLSGMWSEVVGQALQVQKKAFPQAGEPEVSGD